MKLNHNLFIDWIDIQFLIMNYFLLYLKIIPGYKNIR